MSYERDFYIVEDSPTGKLVHFAGFTWLNYGDEWVSEELTFCYVPVSLYDKDVLDLAQERVPHYQYDVEDIETLVMTYFNGKEGKHLPLRDVNEDTPCGYYWCEFEEE